MIDKDFESLLQAGLTVSEAFSNHDGKCRDAWSRLSCNEPTGYKMESYSSKNRPIFDVKKKC